MSWSSRVVAATLLVALLSQHAEALIPKLCAHNATSHHGVCCPVNHENGRVCGGPKRGHCQKIVAPHQDFPSVFVIDDRIGWPLRYFKHACQCKGNFHGLACDECWFGWKGKNCDIRDHRVRRDIRSLSKKSVDIFVDVVKRAATWPSGYLVVDESTNDKADPIKNPEYEEASIQYFIAYNHRYGSRTTLYKDKQDCDKYGVLDFNHDGVVFPTWHRYYLLIWERWLGEIAEKVHGVKDFAVPYWDWIGMDHCDICTDDYIGGEGKTDQYGVRISEKHPWHNLPEFCYEPSDDLHCYGCQHSGIVGKLTRTWNSEDFPTQKDFDFVMKLKDYFVPGERDMEDCKSFHMALEGFCGRPGVGGEALWTHNKLHNMLDGSMCCGGTAANDPLFILHHTLVDKLFSMWYKMHKPKLSDYPQHGVRPGHCRDCFMIGFVPPVRNSDMFVPHEVFGYTYDDAVIGRKAANKFGAFEYII